MIIKTQVNMKKMILIIVSIFSILTTQGQTPPAERANFAIIMTQRAQEENINMTMQCFGIDNKSLLITSPEFTNKEDINNFIVEARWEAFDYMYELYRFDEICIVNRTICFDANEMKKNIKELTLLNR